MAQSEPSLQGSSSLFDPDKDSVTVTGDPLSLDAAYQSVHDTSAGAISTFSGITRDNFNGKKVVRLEYEAYAPMAVAKLKDICHQIRSKWDVCRIAILHRTGVVDVGDPSVIIAVSSVHRAAGLEAARFGIDELKATVPIWKKELYEGREVWKENSEFRPKLTNSHLDQDSKR